MLKGNEFTYDNLADLKGKVIGIQRGASYGQKFEQSKKILSYDEDGSGEQRLLKLLHNRIDVALIGPGKSGLMSVIKRNPELMSRKADFSVISNPFQRDPNYFAFSKKMNRQHLLLEFNKILKKGYQSGDIQKIIQAYSKVP